MNSSRRFRRFMVLACYGFISVQAHAEEARTSLGNPVVAPTILQSPYAVLRRGEIEAVVVDNSAVDDEVLHDHQKGYSGLALLNHRRRAGNCFVPQYAGLNFEHCHDGTNQAREILYEPRTAPMRLRRIGQHVMELYQAPTPHYGMESCIRYELLEDGTIEMTLECIPRRESFRHGYVGLFFASYIQRPESMAIHFRGRDEETGGAASGWICGVTPAHGQLSTHQGAGDERKFEHDPDFPLTLVFNFSRHRYTEPWYYGVSHGMALVFIFRPQDQVRLTQSPSGGGSGNPAWDFQWFIPGYKVGCRYTFVMRMMYLPFESAEQITRATSGHRAALGARTTGTASGPTR